MENTFTIAVYTENQIGLLHRVTTIFTRRHINIESLTVSESEVEGVHRYTIVVNATEVQIKKLVGQLEKQIEIIRARYYLTESTIYQEVALYKISSQAMENGALLERIIRENHARILCVERDCLIIEKTGHQDETRKLFKLLEPFTILEFVRSGRVALTRTDQSVSDDLKALEMNRPEVEAIGAYRDWVKTNYEPVMKQIHQ